MTIWLLKTEPTVYSYADLERDKETMWNGVTNNLALKNLRQIESDSIPLEKVAIMTVGMLLLGIFWSFCGFALAGLLAKSFGAFGFVSGLILGATAAYFFSWAVLVGRLRLFFPLPLCRRGKCQGYDEYYWPVGTVCGWEWWGTYRFRCNCENDEYIREGKRFMVVLPSGEMCPYKKLRGFRHWVDDKPEKR